MRDDIRGRGVGRQAVVLWHVTDELADLGAPGPDVEVEDRRIAGCRLDQSEEDLEQRALAGSVRADQADDSGLDVDRQAIQGRDRVAISLGQVPDRDQGHGPRVTRAAGGRTFGPSTPERPSRAPRSPGQRSYRRAASSATRASVPAS